MCWKINAFIIRILFQVSTPLRQISKQPLIEEAEDTECNDEVEKKIRELTGEVGNLFYKLTFCEVNCFLLPQQSQI